MCSVFIARSKTDPDGRGAYAYLSPRGLAAVRYWVEVAKLAPEDPLLMSSLARHPKRSLGPTTVSRIFKARTRRRDVRPTAQDHRTCAIRFSSAAT